MVGYSSQISWIIQGFIDGKRDASKSCFQDHNRQFWTWLDERTLCWKHPCRWKAILATNRSARNGSNFLWKFSAHHLHSQEIEEFTKKNTSETQIARSAAQTLHCVNPGKAHRPWQYRNLSTLLSRLKPTQTWLVCEYVCATKYLRSSNGIYGWIIGSVKLKFKQRALKRFSRTTKCNFQPLLWYVA